MIKSVSIIGSGNVATHIAKAIYGSGYSIMSIFSPTYENACSLANEVGAIAVSSIADIDKNSDLIIISVKDDVIKDVVSKLSNFKSIIVHTSGGVNIDVFDNICIKCGVLYPLQTFSKQRKIDFKKVPLFIEACNNEVFKEIEDFSKSISDVVYEADSRKRKIMHISAVFACNFVNHCYDIASEILHKENIPFSVLLPLIEETTRKIEKINPYDAQTGPARRNDTNVINSHLEHIENDVYNKIYTLLSDSIRNRYNK